jgi:hypothetical protein
MNEVLLVDALESFHDLYDHLAGVLEGKDFTWELRLVS